tara:strand:- start:2825 stop:3559 length:735 start_codon:yes stop_codon:yes gene_type:complete
MKFSLIFIIFFLFSCSNGTFNTNNNKSYTSKGFALIYDENDYQKKIISTKLNPNNIEIGHNQLNKNSYVVITNPINKKSLTLKVSKKVKYPDFFKVLITEKLANELNLNPKMPYIEIEKRVKNKSFVAKKAVTHSEEKNVLTKVPITKVKINDISKDSKDPSKNQYANKYSIIVGNFYSKKWAESLIDILVNEDINKEVFKVIKLGKNNYQLLAGPYTSINTLKSDYFKLNKYGFDNLDLKKTK